MQRTLLKSITLCLSIVSLLLIFDNRSEVVRATKAQSPEKTVEQVEKNIKVLTGMPVRTLMFFSTCSTVFSGDCALVARTTSLRLSKIRRRLTIERHKVMDFRSVRCITVP